MAVLWSVRTATVRDVHEALNAKRPIAYTTVMTVMTRLAEKGLLKRFPAKGHFEFRAAMTAEEFIRAASQKEVERLLGDFGDLAITHFLEAAARVDPDLWKRLRRLAAQSEDVGESTSTKTKGQR